jgi:hypothetical protein
MRRSKPISAARSAAIREQVESLAAEAGGTAMIEASVLAEVTALCEWPVALLGRFDAGFLEVPPEVLIETMQANQKYFPVVDQEGQLLPCFITISNIESREPDQVRAGNERVIRPRFADAKFFWEQDLKTPLCDRVELCRESSSSISSGPCSRKRSALLISAPGLQPRPAPIASRHTMPLVSQRRISSLRWSVSSEACRG